MIPIKKRVDTLQRAFKKNFFFFLALLRTVPRPVQNKVCFTFAFFSVSQPASTLPLCNNKTFFFFELKKKCHCGLYQFAAYMRNFLFFCFFVFFLARLDDSSANVAFMPWEVFHSLFT